MEVNPGRLHARADRARRPPDAGVSRWCGRPSRWRKSWYDSLQASLRLLPTRGLNLLASYTLGQGHRSRVGPQHRRRAAAGAAGGAGRRGQHRRGARRPRRGRRCSTRGTASCSASATSCRRLDGQRGGAAGHRRRLAAERHLPGADRASRCRSATARVLDIRYMTSRPDVTCDPNDGPEDHRPSSSTPAASPRCTLAETGERSGNAGRNTVRGPGFQRTDLSLFKNFDFAGRHRLQAAGRGVQRVEPGALHHPGANGVVGTAPFGQITAGRGRAGHSAGGSSTRSSGLGTRRLAASGSAPVTPSRVSRCRTATACVARRSPAGAAGALVARRRRAASGRRRRSSTATGRARS